MPPSFDPFPSKLPSSKVRRVPYKDLLQSTLQRRFASTVLILLAVAYVESILMSSWTSPIWSWFPIGIAGLRALAIFGCGLFVVIVRIAHPHVGIRTTNSPFETFRRYVFAYSTAEINITYMLSAFLFSQVYLWSLGEEDNLRWIIYHSGDRQRVNERAVFYTVTVWLVGVWKGYKHAFEDVDRLDLGRVRPKPSGEAATSSPRGEDPFERLLKLAPLIALKSLRTAGIVSVSMYLGGYYFLRQSAWGWAMFWFRFLYHLPKSNIPPSQAPWSVFMLWRTMIAGTFLCFLWDLSNAAYTLLLSKEPLKNEQPLTSDSKDKSKGELKSDPKELKDPNGSLLHGLKSNKPRVASFAMWELALIARDFETRRKAIFEDIDRKDGPMWTQIYGVCLDKIKELEKRTEDSTKGPKASDTEEKMNKEWLKKPARVVEGPLDAKIWKKTSDDPKDSTKDKLGRYVAGVVNTPGKKLSDTVRPFAAKTIAGAKDSLLTKEQQDHMYNTGAVGIMHWMLSYVLRVPYAGDFFRQPFHRRLATIVLGTPYGDASIYVNAAFSLSQLAVASLTEDMYGNVHRDVPTIIRTFTSVIKKLEQFRDELPMHWTDAQAQRQCEAVEEVLDALKDGLLRVVDDFEPYSSDLRLTRADIRRAREAAAKSQAKAGAGVGAGVGRNSQSQQPPVGRDGGEGQPEMMQVR